MKQKTETQGRGYESPSLSAQFILNEAGFCDSMYQNQDYIIDNGWTWDTQSQND